MSDFDTRYTDKIVCPYCGHKHQPDSDFNDLSEWECAECEREFAFEPEFSVSFCSWTMEEEIAQRIKNTERTLRFYSKQGKKDEVRIYRAQIDRLRDRLAKLSDTGAPEGPL